MWHVTNLPIVLLAEERVAKSFKIDPFSSGLPLKGVAIGNSSMC